MNIINYKYKITEKDYIDYNKWFFYEKSNGKRIIRMIPLLVVLNIIFLFFIIYNSNSLNIIIFIFLLILTLFLSLFIPMILRFSAIKAYRNNKEIQQENEYIIDENGFIIHKDEAFSEYKWENVKMVVETKKNYYLFVENNFALIVRKSYIDEDVFRNIILSKLSPDRLEYVKK